MFDGPEGPPACPVKGKSEVGYPCRGTGTLWEDAWASAASETDVLPCCFVLQRTPLKKPRAAPGLAHSWEVLLNSCLPNTSLGARLTKSKSCPWCEDCICQREGVCKLLMWHTMLSV